MKPWPRFHDLLATWKTNATRSKMHPEIEKAITEHSSGLKDVHERYGQIRDEALIQAIDRMTFNREESVVLVAKSAVGAFASRGSNTVSQERRPMKSLSRLVSTRISYQTRAAGRARKRIIHSFREGSIPWPFSRRTMVERSKECSY